MSDEPLREVVNCWTIYRDKEDAMASFRRPQDWGHPRWMDRRYVVEALGCRNEVYCWLETTEDERFSELEHLQFFASLIIQIMQPGFPREVCDRSHRREEDFWQNSWGKMPPIFEEDYEFGNEPY